MTIAIRKLSRAEAGSIQWANEKSAFIMSEYTEALRTLKVGDPAVIDIPPGDTERTVKARAARAASQLNYKLTWARNSPSGTVAFQIKRRSA